MCSCENELEFMREMREFETPFFPDFKNLAEMWHLVSDFPDEKNLLDTAIFSLRRYLSSANCRENENGYQIIIRQCSTGVFEEYNIEIKENSCTISAADTEGIRRGIYEFIDIFCGAGGVFPREEKLINRKPWLKIRLARCPFSPIKRPPLNTDELLDDTDYYPDAYLETLAHDGSNGIWIVTSVNELGSSSFISGDAQRQTRLTKLRKTAAKCARYGIKVWLFMIEPRAVSADSEMYRNHPGLFKQEPLYGQYCFCPASEKTLQYLREIFSSTFAAVPELGGVINISAGERATICTSTVLPSSCDKISCQNICKLSQSEIMRRSLAAIKEGIKQSAPDAELISWFYLPHATELAPWAAELANSTPHDAIAQYNFESGGKREQLGKIRIAGDYWISYEGPSDNFRNAAAARRPHPMGAKLQLGSGHELVTVPYIPVPGIAYNKYKTLHDLGIISVMQSWYIGNFTGLLGKACGKLGFENFSSDSNDFLLQLALPQWGRHSTTVMRAWQIFTEAYCNMPFSLMFQYYGPQNAFLRWKYHFLPDLEILAPPWKPDFEFGGDNIGEALAGFTLDEVSQLLETMSEKWQHGLDILLPLKDLFKDAKKNIRDINIAEFIGYSLEGSSNLLKFFQLRKKLYSPQNNFDEYRSILADMKKCLAVHCELCKKCIPLLEYDSRLGYHGESLKRLFDANDARRALIDAEAALATANELEKSLQNGKTPFEYIAEKKLIFAEPETIYRTKSYSWSYQIIDDKFVMNIENFSGNDLWGRCYFTDLTGTEYPLQERFHLQHGKCEDLGNFNYLLTGKHFASGMKTNIHNGKITISWNLQALPGSSDGLIRFNFSLGELAAPVYLNGQGTKERLYLEMHDPADTLTLKVKTAK